MSQGLDFPGWPKAFADVYRAKGYWVGVTLSGILKRQAQQLPGNIAVSEGQTHLTYAELDERASRLADGLAKLGLQPGDRVVIQLPNSIRFLETIFAVFRLGAIPVLALPSDRISEISHILRQSGAKAYVIQDTALGFDYCEIARQVSGRLPGLEHVIVSGNADTFIDFESIYGSKVDFPERLASAPALIMLSGGSTALPKLIVRTHDDYIYSFRASAEICNLDQHSVYLCVLPAGHNFTMSSPGIFGVLQAGGRVVMTVDPSGPSAFSLIEREKITFTSLVPSLALSWLQSEREHDLSSLQFIQVGGARLSDGTAARMVAAFDCKLQQVYGMTEGLVCYTRFDDGLDRVLHTQGLPISSDDEIKIVDENDQLVASGDVGELLVRGPYTIRGYLNAPEHNARAFTSDGFYRTGDLVKRLEDGYLVVEGRLKDQVNRGGEKISSEEIEGHLLAHPLVREVAIVGIPDPFLGEASCAYIVSAADTPPTLREIKMFIRARGLANFKIPDQVRIISSLPKTTLGKIDKQELRNKFTDECLDLVGSSKISV